MFGAGLRSSIGSLRTVAQRRLISSSPATSDAAASAKKTAEGASKQLSGLAEKAKELGGPVAQRLQGALGGYAEPLIYNAKVVGHVAKQVYIAESLAPPTSFNVVRESLQTLYRRAIDGAYWQKLLRTGEWRKVGLYAVEAYGIFTIGEMIGRRSLVGYKLETHGDAHHH
ncbi:unnamed protein product [Parajaminaea phylloscopi]